MTVRAPRARVSPRFSLKNTLALPASIVRSLFSPAALSIGLSLVKVTLPPSASVESVSIATSVARVTAPLKRRLSPVVWIASRLALPPLRMMPPVMTLSRPRSIRPSV